MRRELRLRTKYIASPTRASRTTITPAIGNHTFSLFSSSITVASSFCLSPASGTSPGCAEFPNAQHAGHWGDFESSLVQRFQSRRAILGATFAFTGDNHGHLVSSTAASFRACGAQHGGAQAAHGHQAARGYCGCQSTCESVGIHRTIASLVLSDHFPRWEWVDMKILYCAQDSACEKPPAS